MGLSLMSRHDLGNCLEFENNLVLYHEIGDILAHQLGFIVDWQDLQSLERNTPRGEFIGKCVMVHCLQKAGTQYAMHFHCRTDYSVGKLFE